MIGYPGGDKETLRRAGRRKGEKVGGEEAGLVHLACIRRRGRMDHREEHLAMAAGRRRG